MVTVEGTASYELPKVWVFVPTLSGTIGGQFGSDAQRANSAAGIVNGGVLKGFTLGNGENSLAYWNVGFTLAVDKLSFDFRYWGNSIKDNNALGGGVNGFCTGRFNQCDDQYVFTAKFTY